MLVGVGVVGGVWGVFEYLLVTIAIPSLLQLQ